MTTLLGCKIVKNPLKGLDANFQPSPVEIHKVLTTHYMMVVGTKCIKITCWQHTNNADAKSVTIFFWGGYMN